MGDRDSVEMYMGRTDRKVTTMKDDTISRAAALDALNGLTKIFLNNLPPTIDRADAVDAIKALPSAQPECEDAVSREAAIKEAEEWIEAIYFDHEEQRERDAIKHVIGSLRNLPPVTPKQSGWISCRTRIQRRRR